MKYFIPQIIERNGIQIPSTPFNLNNGRPLLMGDVFEVTFENKQVFVADMKDGQYIGLSKVDGVDMPLYLLEEENVRVLGNSVEKPELLDLLTSE